MTDLDIFIATLQANREARSKSLYASDKVYALLDAYEDAKARLAEAERVIEPFAEAGHVLFLTGGKNPKMSGPRMAEHLERARTWKQGGAEMAPCQLKLTEAQQQILAFLSRRKEYDGAPSGPEISATLGHASFWASGKLAALVRRELVERLGQTTTGGQCYGITEAGRLALKQGGADAGN